MTLTDAMKSIRFEMVIFANIIYDVTVYEMIELIQLFVSTINEILAINACITVGGTKEHCQTTTEFSKEAEDLQGTIFS